MQIDLRSFRDALGGFCTGVTVVTTRTSDATKYGVTANSFSSVSLEPPLVLFCLDRKTASLSAFEKSGHFAINVLANVQDKICAQFARPDGDQWQGVAHEQWQTGAPIIEGCVSNFDCRTYSIQDGGDHLIFVGEVLRMASSPDLEPMLYFRGQFHELNSAS